MLARPRSPLELVVSLDARWARGEPGDPILGAFMVAVPGHPPVYGGGGVWTPAELYGCALVASLEEIEAEGGGAGSTLVLRFPAKRGAAFARLITREDPATREGTLHRNLWEYFRHLHARGLLRMGWTGSLRGDLVSGLRDRMELTLREPTTLRYPLD